MQPTFLFPAFKSGIKGKGQKAKKEEETFTERKEEKLVHERVCPLYFGGHQAEMLAVNEHKFPATDAFQNYR